MRRADSRSFPPVLKRFGPFQFNAAKGELRRHGIRLPLRGQPIQILEVLLENAGRTVTRDELREAIWPGNVHVDFDAALNTAIKKLRQTLEDDAVEARYIATVPKVGYRFVAAVELVMPQAPPLSIAARAAGAGSAALPASAPSEDPAALAAEVPEAVSEIPPHFVTEPRRRRIYLWIAVPAIALTLAAAWALFHFMPRRLTVAHRAFLTSLPANQERPSISPDGGQVAFSWEGPDQKNTDIYVTSMTGLGLRRLTTDPQLDLAPAWSPNGSEIAFLRREEHGEDSIIVIPSSGGPERRVAATAGFFTAWTPDSTAVLAARLRPGERKFELVAVSVSSGETRAVTQPGEFMDAWQPFGYSPDGRMLAYAAWPDAKSLPQLYVRPASGGKPQRVTWFETSLRGWCWLPDSQSILVASNENGPSRLFRVRVHDPHPAAIAVEGAGDDVRYPAAVPASGGSATLVVEQLSISSNIYAHQLRLTPDGRPDALLEPALVAPSTRLSTSPQISPDGRRMTFVSNRSLFGEIWLADADGGNPHPLTSLASPNRDPGSPRWSPDGRRIVFDVAEQAVHNLYLASTDGAPVAQLTHGTFDAIRPTWSHDGAWIYFSRRSSEVGLFSLWKIPSRAGATERDCVPLLGLNGFEPIESPDGGTLFYMTSNMVHQLWSVPLTGGTPRRVISSGVYHGWWTPVRNGVVYVDLTLAGTNALPARNPILYYDLTSSRSTQIGILDGARPRWQPGLSITPDLSRLYTIRLTVADTNLVRAELH